MAGALDYVGSYVWSEKFWFPENVSWKDIENHDEGPNAGIYHPQISDLIMPIPVAVLLGVIRFCFERFIAAPIGRSYGLREGKIMVAEYIPILEKAYRKTKRPDDKAIEGFSKKLSKSTRQVERWFRKRRNQDRSSELKKFCESGWRFLFYVSAHIYGTVILWNKRYFAETLHCWIGWPHQHVSSDLYWYYMIELGFYVALAFSLMTDVRRKDFYEMIIHHIATIGLLTFSWINNMVRIGSLVLVVHDAVDYWMEGAKMAKYIRKQKICDAMFVVFAVVWFVTRLVIFPICIIKPIMVTPGLHNYVPGWPGLTLMKTQLIILLGLHIVWTYFIGRIAVKSVLYDNVQKDERSDSESAVTEEETNGTVLDGNLNVNKKKE
ncbi:ceramide synthase 5-like isoform X2 [Lineus longissimus]|uniref:ceramide synthase 5-like isoform X2 n=1 Tax=Lineus longissimus TaxID=88925 RepID=UPI00315C5427